MCREHGKGSISIRYSQDVLGIASTNVCVIRAANIAAAARTVQEREKGDLEAEQGTGKRIRMHPGIIPLA